MSLSTVPAVPICVLDPRAVVIRNPKYAVLKGATRVELRRIATTSISTSSITWSCPPPSNNVFVDRNVRLYLPVRLSFQGIPAAGQTLLRSGFDAPRSMPLSGSINTLTATINGQTVSIDLADTVHPLLWTNVGVEWKNRDSSTTPVTQDQSTSYDSLVGTNRNVLSDYGATGDNVPAPRGAFCNMVIIANPVGNGVATVTAVVDVAFEESLFLPPMFWGVGVSSHAFYNVSTFDITATFLSQAANRMWSHSAAFGGVPITSSALAFGNTAGGPTSFPSTGNQPLAYFTYLTPDPDLPLGINTPLVYPYFQVLRFQTTQAPVLAGATTTMTSSTQTLSSIPRRIMIAVRQQTSDAYSSTSSTDTYFSINNLSMQFFNDSGLFASAQQDQLYLMSASNGLNMTYSQWVGRAPPIGTFAGPQIGTVGSIIIIEPGKDLGLSPIDAPGKVTQLTIQVQVSATNTSTQTITPELLLIIINEGTFTIGALNDASINVGVIKSEDILECRKDPGVSYKDIQSVVGEGDFLSGFKEGLAKLGSYAKGQLPKIAAYAKQQVLEKKALSRLASKVPALAPAVPILQQFGLGDGGCGCGGCAECMMGRMRGRGDGVLLGNGDGGVMAGRARALLARRRKARGGEAMSREELGEAMLY